MSPDERIAIRLARSLQQRECMPFTKILCPTDASAGSRQAIRVAARLADENNAALVLLHVQYMPPLTFAGEAYPATLMGQMADDAQRGLDEAMTDAAAAGAKYVTTRLVTGIPWDQIVGLIEREAFDLCVMGTHGRTGLRRVLLGSVAERVVRHAACSVLAVRADGEPKPFTHVLCPTDFSASSDHALDVAAELVRPGGAGITLLHVIEVPDSYVGVRSVDELARELDRRTTEALDEAAARVQRRVSVPVTTRARVGRPGAQLLAALDDDASVDLVVMGSHGRTGIKRVLLGSVAEKVVRNAACSVLVTRTRR